MSKILIVIGVIAIILGVLWPLIMKLGLGHLPGDIVVRRKNVTVYFPIVTSIVISVLVTGLLWLFRK